ncbi:MAG: DUF721 domain-containing protein [Schwartzia sp. (in: firmicutes)]
MARTRTAETVGEFLPRFLHSFAGKKKYQEHLVFLRWPDIVGEMLAAHVKPVRFDFRTLFLCADAPVWAQELQYMLGTLRDKINGYVGAELVREIRFGAGIGRKRVAFSAPLVEKATWQPPEERERQRAETACGVVEEERVRAAAARAMAQSLARTRQEAAAGGGACLRCGAPGGGKARLCPACVRQRRKEKRAALRRILEEKPWIRYHEAAKLLDVSPDFVLSERRRLVQAWASRLTIKDDIGEEEKRLAMLFASLPPEALTEEKVRQVMHRLRFDLRPDWEKAKAEKTLRRPKIRPFSSRR